LERMLWVEAASLGGGVLLLIRAAGRLKGHFHERHYRPVADVSQKGRDRIDDRPLSWWAVRRVQEYSGRINLWLAAGFGLAYAAYTVAGPHWPAWMGCRVFEFFEYAGGIPGIAAALMVLAAVPAAFQYGLWDSTVQDRCRRLELLLLTRLDAHDYWHAAASAAWRRGRGYFMTAVLLWLAATLAGKIDVAAMIATFAAGVLLWSLYFTLGFRAFSRGLQANMLGILLTIGLPLSAYGLHRAGWTNLASLVPPGSVYRTAAGSMPWEWLAGSILAGTLTLILARSTLRRCDAELRRWYAQNHGRGIVN